jgi:hypothetical protein
MAAAKEGLRSGDAVVNVRLTHCELPPLTNVPVLKRRENDTSIARQFGRAFDSDALHVCQSEGLTAILLIAVYDGSEIADAFDGEIFRRERRQPRPVPKRNLARYPSRWSACSQRVSDQHKNHHGDKGNS